MQYGCFIFNTEKKGYILLGTALDDEDHAKERAMQNASFDNAGLDKPLFDIADYILKVRICRTEYGNTVCGSWMDIPRKKGELI